MARRRITTAVRQAARRNIRRAHLANFRSRRPRSIGWIRPDRRLTQRR